MLKPPAPTIPGMTDTLDFVKNLWGSMNIPGAGMPGVPGLTAPPLSTDELDKRIADLKAVEAWLNMNVTMLRGTIQALEVQRGTLAALKSMSASMADAMRQSGISTDKMGAMPFASFFTPPGPSTGAKPAAPAPAQASAAPAGGGSAQPGAAAPAGADAGAAAMGMPAAVAWWNMLQDQFTQAVSAAMSPAPPASPAAPNSAAPAPAPTASAPEAKAVPPAPAPSASANANAGSNAGADADANAEGNPAGNGKARTPRSRTDKA
jgi:hypothetical protein